MISVWWWVALIPSFILGFIAAGILSASSTTARVAKAYFSGLEKGHEDMQERIVDVLKGREDGICASCGVYGSHKEGPRTCDKCLAKFSSN